MSRDKYRYVTSIVETNNNEAEQGGEQELCTFVDDVKILTKVKKEMVRR